MSFSTLFSRLALESLRLISRSQGADIRLPPLGGRSVSEVLTPGFHFSHSLLETSVRSPALAELTFYSSGLGDQVRLFPRSR